MTVKGRGNNRTDIRVHLHTLTDPASQTNFENCVADVNIPVGEVFTSPLLSGTDGELFVENVYIGDIQFKNLSVQFENGRVTGYMCDNFADPEENKALICGSEKISDRRQASDSDCRKNGASFCSWGYLLQLVRRCAYVQSRWKRSHCQGQ